MTSSRQSMTKVYKTREREGLKSKESIKNMMKRPYINNSMKGIRKSC